MFPIKLNIAQRILIALGVDKDRILVGHYREKFESYTKKGPGRKHKQGKSGVK